MAGPRRVPALHPPRWMWPARPVVARSGSWAQLASSNEIDFLVIRYLNRLSDLLWLLARYTETQLGPGPESAVGNSR